MAERAGSDGPPRPGRLDRHRVVADAISHLTDDVLVELLDGAAVLQLGIGGTIQVIEIAGESVFVKRVPLTALEGRSEHVRSTANLFDLPMCCHYGVGAPSFGAWRELAALEMATEWVLHGRSPSFPILFGRRRLALAASVTPLSDELADIDRVVEYWHGSPAVRHRIESITSATETVALFLEYLPGSLADWLDAQMDGGDADAAISAVERQLHAGVDTMTAAGLFHFDTHFGNLLADDDHVYITDFGLAASRAFDLSPAESAFLDANQTHDVAHTVTRLVDWLVTALTDVPNWLARDEFIRAVADGEPLPDMPTAAAELITRQAPLAVVINEFYRQLHLEDRRTPYPADKVRRALDQISRRS